MYDYYYKLTAFNMSKDSISARSSRAIPEVGISLSLSSARCAERVQKSVTKVYRPKCHSNSLSFNCPI